MENKLSMRSIVILTASVIGVVVGLIITPMLVENISADEIVVIQSVTGKLDVYTQSGPVWQGMGRVTSYKKREQYSFSAKKDQGKSTDESIDVTFNDGGHGKISGVVSWEMPTAHEAVIKLHTLFGSQHAIEQQLVRPAIEKSIYLTGPMMSSTESYSSRRSEFLQLFEDQARNGIYKTEAISTKQTDPVSGVEKTISLERIAMKDGVPQRQSGSALKEFGIMLESPAIDQMIYDSTVKSQIETQQKAVAQIQTSQAQAREAENQAITTEKQGQAAAAKAKWEQETIKAKMVTEAQQKLEVATLGAKEAEQKKREQILLGEGEAERKRLVMQADGALEKKLEAWLQAQEYYANAIKDIKHPIVPTIVMGGSGVQPSAQSLLDMLSVKTAKELSLDMSMQGNKK